LIRGLYLEPEELVEIAISVIAISFAFTLIFAGINGLLKQPKEFFVFMGISFVTVGSGFILHEMAHKLVAIFYGAPARFKMWMQGLLVMLVTSCLGFLFAAPGAVYIFSDRITNRQNGIISIVGPGVNFVLVGVFLLLSYFAPVVFHLNIIGEPVNVWYFGARMNLMLALFNMIPAYPLDGSKVIRWNMFVWILSSFILLAVGSIIISPFIFVSWGILMIIALVFSKFAFG
jgi:Zn-dependent protease